MAEDHFVAIDGTRMRYWCSGQGEETVVLVHGLGASADIWVQNIEELARGHQVIVPDLPGFGKSEIPPPSFLPFQYTDFLAKLIDTITDGPVILVGQSLGGAVVLDYALQHPERTDRLVLLDSAGFGREVIWTLRLLSLPFIGELLCHPARKGVEVFFKLAVHNSAVVTEGLVDIFHGYFRRPGFKRFFLGLVRGLIDMRGARTEILGKITANLHKIAKQVLIIWGREDRVLPLKHAYFGAAKLACASLKVMSGCGHLPFLERPEECNRLMLEFIGQGHEGARGQTIDRDICEGVPNHEEG
jgi:4,5:9,10-diseco-3-hydroxy-5,9,17-trioxoandrosta-1(10),2-diene-4-oate hydrolase